MAAVDLTRTTVFFVGDNGTFERATDAPFRSSACQEDPLRRRCERPAHRRGGGGRRAWRRVRSVGQHDRSVRDGDGAGGAERFRARLREPAAVPLRSRAGLAQGMGYAERFKPNGYGPYQVRERALRDSRYKLIRRWSELEGRSAEHEMYDLASDPFERETCSTVSSTPAQELAFTRLRCAILELSGPDSGGDRPRRR